MLGAAPPAAFLETLRGRGVPISVGRVIVATWEPHQAVVLDAIRELGLELHVVFNKGAVMVLPPQVNKATGLAAALAELKLSPHNVVGVGDAENDHAFLAACECAVAVANALPALKERADFVTRGDHGAGVEELIDHLVADDLAAAGGRGCGGTTCCSASARTGRRSGSPPTAPTCWWRGRPAAANRR